MLGGSAGKIEAKLSCARPVKSHGLPVSLTDFGNFSRLTAGRHNAHGYL